MEKSKLLSDLIFLLFVLQAIAAGVVASIALAQAEDTRYAQLQKEYEALAPRLEEMGFGEIGSFGMGNLGPITGLVSGPFITLIF